MPDDIVNGVAARLGLHTPYGALVWKLRDEYRLKVGVDFAITFKYHKYHLLTHNQWFDTITSEARRCGVEFETIHSY